MSQTVNFTQPTVISQLQVQNGSPPYFNKAQTITNVNKFLYGPVMPYSASTALPFLKVATGAGASQDAKAQTCLTWAGLIGNAFTDEEVFISTGAVNSAGATWDQDVLMPLASSAKLYNSFVWMKALEEKLISINDPVGQYLPEWNSGNYYYYTGNCTGVFGTNAVAPVWSAYTGPLATGALSEITIGQCISLNLGWPYPGPSSFCRGIQDAFIAPTTAGTPVDWAEMNSLKDFYLAVQNGIAYAQAGSGPTQAFADPAAMWDPFVARFTPIAQTVNGPNTMYMMTGVVSDTLANALKLIKNGKVPMMYKVGSTFLNPVTGIKQQKATYSILPYLLLSACVSKAVVAAGYANMFDYMNQKILQPLDISTNQIYMALYQPAPTGAVLAETCGRRIDYMCSGTNWIGFSADPTQYQAGLDYISSTGATGYAFNSCYYRSRFPKDVVLNIYENGYWSTDPYGWGLQGQITCSFKAWKSIVKLFINKGRYNNKQIMSRAMLNWGQNNSSAPGAFYNQYSATPGSTSVNQRWCALQCYNYDGKDIIADINQNTADYPGTRDGVIIPTISNNIFWWAGSSGTSWNADIDSGFYTLVYDAMSTGLNNSKAISSNDTSRYIQQSL
jgi:CubicO group peptidase (beta-lactamase class C family)